MAAHRSILRELERAGASYQIASTEASTRHRPLGQSHAQPLQLTGLRLEAEETRTRRLAEARTFSVSELAALPTNAAGRTLLQMPSLAPGHYSVRLDIEGIIEGVGPIERTAYYFLPILEQSHRLTGKVESRVLDDERLELRLGLEHLTSFDTHLFAYAEVWAPGTRRPVAWIGGMTYPETGADGGLVLPVVFDARWLPLAGVKGRDLELRNVRIQDPDTFVPVHQVALMPLVVDELPAAALGRSRSRFSARTTP